jgi:ceramide synthetase
MLEFGVYISASCFLFTESRKFNADFGIMVVHHLVTLVLLLFGWSLKLYNISIATAALHDFSDVLLEYSKIFYYYKKKTVSNVLFFVFAFAFMSSRLFVFPRFIIAPWYNGEFKEALGFWPYGKVQTTVIPAILSVLVLLHFIWSIFIVRVLYNIVKGKKAGEQYEKE